jgi:cell division protease FtsH
MKRRMGRSAFKELCQHIGHQLAYGTLRSALRATPQFQRNAGGLIIAVVNTDWLERYKRAGELLMTGRRRALFNSETSRRRAIVFKAGSKAFDLDLLVNQQTILLTDSLRALPRRVRMTADAIVSVKKPTARFVLAARRLAGKPPLPIDIAEHLVVQDWPDISVLAGRQSLNASDFQKCGEVEGNAPEIVPRLSELTGFGAAKEWTDNLLFDIPAWQARKLPWNGVSRCAILIGPPGVGKTMFAQALAAELQIPIITTSVGTWQSEDGGNLGTALAAMHAVFELARSKAPCILFVDEVDSIGKRGLNRPHQFYEANMVNRFLQLSSTEMQGVILLAATNRVEDIDPAVLRSGRFEEHIEIGLPSDEERAAILAFHLDRAIPVEAIRKSTDPLHHVTPADLAKYATHAKRSGRRAGRSVSVEDIEAVLPKRILLSEDVLRRIAVHECGHGLVAMTSGFVEKVSISLESSVSEGDIVQSAGRTDSKMKDQILPTEALLRARIRICLAGMIAEEVVHGSRSIGGAGIINSDLHQATQIATRMVVSYGFGRIPRFHTDIYKVDEHYRPPPEVRPEIDAILLREWKAVKELLTREKNRLMRLAAELVVGRCLELHSD